MTRRDFIKTASTATLSALAAGFPRPVLAEPEAENQTNRRHSHRALDGRRHG